MAKIKLNNNEYQIPDSALTPITADFVAHLQTIAGTGMKVVVGGVEYNVDSNKVAGAVANFGAFLGGLETYTPGLYETGAIKMYEEQGAAAIEGMLITSWDELKERGRIDDYQPEGVSCYYYYTNSLTGDLMFPHNTASTFIAVEGFDSCRHLTGVYLPSIRAISNYAFRDCERLTVVDAHLAESIGMSVFDGCSNLRAIILRTTATVCEIDLSSFVLEWNGNVPKTLNDNFYIPASMYEAYRAVYEPAFEQAGFAGMFEVAFHKIEDLPEIPGGPIPI